jgi:membrane protein
MDQTVRDAGGAATDGTGADRAFPFTENEPSRTPPARSWKDVALAVFKGISADRIFLIAAGVTFYAILALFPAIGAVVSIYGIFANPSTIAGHLDTLAGVAPGGAVDVIRDQLTHLANQNGTALSVGFAVSLLIALWFSNSGMTGLFDALNVVYEEKEQRSLFKYYATTLAFTAGAVVLVLVSIAIIVALPVALHYIPDAGLTAILLKVIRWPLLFVLIVTALVVLYRYAPCRNSSQRRWIIWSSVVAAAVWLGVSALFSWYVASFGSYNKTYGSLGAIFGFMTWMWLSTVVVLVGAKLDVELERHTAPDRAAGPPGTRGATDTKPLGPSRV